VALRGHVRSSATHWRSARLLLTYCIDQRIIVSILLEMTATVFSPSTMSCPQWRQVTAVYCNRVAAPRFPDGAIGGVLDAPTASAGRGCKAGVMSGTCQSISSCDLLGWQAFRGWLAATSVSRRCCIGLAHRVYRALLGRAASQGFGLSPPDGRKNRLRRAVGAGGSAAAKLGY
jgi:hypothetical protein